MFRKVRTLLIILTLVTVSSTPTFAGLESVDHLNKLAKEFIENTVNISADDKLEVNASAASSTIEVAECGEPITVSFPPNTPAESTSTVEMRCTSPQAWHIYLPIEVRIMTRAVIAKQPIPAKEVITEDMLDYAQFDKNHMYSGYFKELHDVVGQEAVSTFSAGTMITKHGLQKPILIHRSQNVSIIAQKGMIMVKADGIAKSDGGINDMIKVFNPASKRMIDGIVINSTSVQVSS